MSNIYDNTISDLQHCKSIRNQYAHCHWFDDVIQGLKFVKLEDTAKKASNTVTYKIITLDLLKYQLSFFKATQAYLKYLHEEYRVGGTLSRPAPQKSRERHGGPTCHFCG